jgi:xylulokinase
MIITSEKILSQSAVDATDIKGISFCSQMQGLVLVVRQGRTIRNAFSYLNQRATCNKAVEKSVVDPATKTAAIVSALSNGLPISLNRRLTENISNGLRIIWLLMSYASPWKRNR